jgi:hypothetical protein
MLRIRGILAIGILLAALPAASVSAAELAEAGEAILSVPHRAQMDGTIWAESNCGPATTGMVLEYFGVDLPTQRLRDRANQLLGIASPHTGTRLQDLAQIVREQELETYGLYVGAKFRRWTLDELRREVLAGRPVIAQVRLDLLPNQPRIPFAIDHYVAIVGVSGENFIFNDPALRGSMGYRYTITPEQLKRSWGSSNFPFAAFAVGPGTPKASADRVVVSSRGATAGGWRGAARATPRWPERGFLIVDGW